MAIHHIRYEHNAALKLYRAFCSCGWVGFDAELVELTARASGHDLWLPLKEMVNGQQAAKERSDDPVSE